jgi:hypothetical protein
MVIRGSQERVAPVLMTATTTALALIPLVLDAGQPGKEILYPVALVVLGGVTTSTLLDFCVTPTVFLRFARRGSERLLDAAKREQEQPPMSPMPRPGVATGLALVPAGAAGDDGKGIAT